MSIEGGVKQKKENINQIQEIINKRLLDEIDMKIFVHDKEFKLTANLHGAVCPKCKSYNKTYAETIQTRSGDEASDRLCTCLVCGYCWKISGSSL